MLLLAIDTATSYLNLALHDGENILLEYSLNIQFQNHTTISALTIKTLLRQAKFHINDLTAIAVIIGPGSYTRVRVGVALAKGIASVNSLSIIGLTSFEVLVAGQPRSNKTLIAVLNAGRKRIIVGRYRWASTKWVTRGEMQILDWQSLFYALDKQVIITGEFDNTVRETYQNRLATDLGCEVTFATAPYRSRRAGFAAEIALEKLNQGTTEQFTSEQIVPIYIK